MFTHTLYVCRVHILYIDVCFSVFVHFLLVCIIICFLYYLVLCRFIDNLEIYDHFRSFSYFLWAMCMCVCMCIFLSFFSPIHLPQKYFKGMLQRLATFSSKQIQIPIQFRAENMQHKICINVQKFIEK